LGGFAAQAQPSGADANVAARWITIDTGSATLTVSDASGPRLVLRDIAIGRYGTSADKRRGDNSTPTGRFRVAAIRDSPRFHRFIALDYPDLAHALRARQQGVIGQRQWHAIAAAHARSELPPQDTPLGGHIGIHGLGRGDPELHQVFNWTRGCIALTDAQVDALLPWVQVGMPVEIRAPSQP
jgi:murein L,D-transpeptidase YafK